MSGVRDCPRWDSCSAPVCPLDPDWPLTGHLRGERVCLLLCELVKPDGEARLRGALPTAVVDRLVIEAPKVAARWYPIRKRLGSAAHKGSRMAAGHRLARWKEGTGDVAMARKARPGKRAVRPTVPRGRGPRGATP